MSNSDFDDCANVIEPFIDAFNTIYMKFAEPNEGIFFTGSIRKLWMYGQSALKLAREPCLPNGEQYDFNSIQVISRAVLETAGVFKYIWIDSEDKKRKFLLHYHKMCGLIGRAKVANLNIGNFGKDKLASEQIKIEEMKYLLPTFDFYVNELSSDQQKLVFEGKWKMIKKSDLPNVLGFMGSAGQVIYSHQSDFAHNGFISLMQSTQAQDQKSKELADSALIPIAICYSVLFEELSEIYPSLKDYINRNQEFHQAINLFKDLRLSYW